MCLDVGLEQGEEIMGTGLQMSWVFSRRVLSAVGAAMGRQSQRQVCEVPTVVEHKERGRQNRQQKASREGMETLGKLVGFKEME